LTSRHPQERHGVGWKAGQKARGTKRRTEKAESAEAWVGRRRGTPRAGDTGGWEDRIKARRTARPQGEEKRRKARRTAERQSCRRAGQPREHRDKGGSGAVTVEGAAVGEGPRRLEGGHKLHGGGTTASRMTTERGSVAGAGPGWRAGWTGAPGSQRPRPSRADEGEPKEASEKRRARTSERQKGPKKELQRQGKRPGERAPRADENSGKPGAREDAEGRDHVGRLGRGPGS